MEKKQILTIAIVVWFGFAMYWYICKIKGQCQQPTGNKIEVVQDVPDSAPENSTIYFQASSATNYTDTGTVDSELKNVAEYLKTHGDKKVTLTGYTANLGRTAGYTQMSLARANVIKQKLVGLGVDSSQIVVEAKGVEGQSSNASEEEKAKSRRVEIIVSSK